MIGREYGIGKYGRNTYDHWRGDKWVPEPGQSDAWIPEPPSAQAWGAEVAPATEIWVPEPNTPQIWTPIV